MVWVGSFCLIVFAAASIAEGSVISTGRFHSCSVSANNRMACWGYSAFGRLGNLHGGSFVPVVGDGTYDVIVAGGWRTCGIKAEEKGWRCWGDARYRSENGDAVFSQEGPERFVSLSVGMRHACGITTTRAALCWGYNDYGQLGTTRVRDFSAGPIAVSGGYDWASISLKGSHTCGILINGTAMCWGRNDNGQVGNGGPGTSINAAEFFPQFVAGDMKWKKLDAGYSHTCGINFNNALMCWGSNEYGKLGDGGDKGSSSSVPKLVAGNRNWHSVTAGLQHTCGITFVDTLFLERTTSLLCWGRNFDGELGGNLTGIAYPQPVNVIGIDRWTTVVTQGSHTCGIGVNGMLSCWGSNARRQVRDDIQASEVYLPLHVRWIAAWKSLSVGTEHSCATATNGTSFCWGTNANQQLLNGLQVAYYRDIEGEFRSIVAGAAHTCAVRLSNDAAVCFGSNRYWQALSETVINAGFIKWASLTAGGFHTCGIALNGTGFCWGSNAYGQLGNGNTIDANKLTRVAGDKLWKLLSAGDTHTCGITTDDEAYCWGGNAYRQLGDTTRTGRTTPVPVAGDESFATISAGSYHTCGILKSSPIIKCWGANDKGQLGDGTTVSTSRPSNVRSTLKWVSVDAGEKHTCGIATDGRARCWGANRYGQLGDGSTRDAITPKAVASTETWLSVSAGSYHTCGMRTKGDTRCWGSNKYWQVEPLGYPGSRLTSPKE